MTPDTSNPRAAWVPLLLGPTFSSTECRGLRAQPPPPLGSWRSWAPFLTVSCKQQPRGDSPSCERAGLCEEGAGMLRLCLEVRQLFCVRGTLGDEGDREEE